MIATARIAIALLQHSRFMAGLRHGNQGLTTRRDDGNEPECEPPHQQQGCKPFPVPSGSTDKGRACQW